MNLSGIGALKTIGIFLAIWLLLRSVPDDAQVLLPLLMFAFFVRAAIKSPPIAIAILLYYSMILGSWFILAAAPVTILLARRYQRQRLDLELDPVHIRRTVLLAMAALVATLPFIAASLGPWSARGQSSAGRSASPLIPQRGSGEEGALQRFARWLGFGNNGDTPQSGLEPLQPIPVRPPEPDDPFNWWILVAVLAIIALLVLAWWLWRRSKSIELPAYAPAPATPLARLEAVGKSIGRPRAPFEGAITYGRVLAKRTGDARLAVTGPLVSSQVYESAVVNPRDVDSNLAGIEAAPPPPLPKPSLGERLSARFAWLHFSLKGAIIALVVVILVIASAWYGIGQLGDLDDSNLQFRAALQSRGL